MKPINYIYTYCAFPALRNKVFKCEYPYSSYHSFCFFKNSFELKASKVNQHHNPLKVHNMDNKGDEPLQDNF